MISLPPARGSTGRGKEFTNAGDLEWGTAMHEDLIDAVEWAIAEQIAHSTAIGWRSWEVAVGGMPRWSA